MRRPSDDGQAHQVAEPGSRGGPEPAANCPKSAAKLLAAKRCWPTDIQPVFRPEHQDAWTQTDGLSSQSSGNTEDEYSVKDASIR